ncbi:hypothetical protein ACHAXS_011208 [Conticribra weissflogii]
MMSFFSFSKCFSHLITFYYLIAAFIISCSDVADGAFVPSSLKVRNHRSESIGFSPSNSSPLPIKNWNRIHPKKLRQQLNNEDNYYGGFDTSRVVREFSLYEQLEEIVNLASQPLPQRPDGIVTVVKFTSSTNPDCRASEASYERLARDNPATIFLRCFKEMEGMESMFSRARVSEEILPCFDMFYKGNRVARIDGPRYSELEALLNQYQFLNSDLDLFSESAQNSNNFTPHPSPWGNGAPSSSDFSKTPRTTAAFIPGYDWNRKGGFFDEVAKDLEKKSGFDFEKSYEDDWMPKIDD